MSLTTRSSSTRRAAALVMALSLGAAACASDDPEAAPETTVTEQTDETTDAMEDEEAEVGTIVDVAVANGSFTTLVAAVQAADLVDTLNSEGPFTVFAPTDDAFAAALDSLGMTAEELLADTETLTTILTYHVIPGAVASGDLADGMTAATVQGEEITVDLSDGVKINDVNVIIPDVEASNGIIHAIDGVLLPPTVMEALGLGDAMEDEDAMEDGEVGTIVDVAIENGSFMTLVAAVQAADLVDTLNSEGPFTVFAPTDDAFAAALEALDMTAEELLADTETLTAILTYHVVPGEVLSTDLTDGMTAATVQGEEITVDLSDGVKINDVNVIIPDVEASNGVIHAIDAVLLPPTVAAALGL